MVPDYKGSAFHSGDSQHTVLGLKPFEHHLSFRAILKHRSQFSCYNDSKQAGICSPIFLQEVVSHLPLTSVTHPQGVFLDLPGKYTVEHFEDHRPCPQIVFRVLFLICIYLSSFWLLICPSNFSIRPHRTGSVTRPLCLQYHA